MGKKRTPVFRDGSATNANREGGKIKAIRTWDDIEHDSEDDFHDERGKILLDDQVGEDNELSEEEVYGLEGLSSEEDEEEEEPLSDDDIFGEKHEEKEDEKAWGQSKKAYYNADDLSDLDEMREEENEALRIQKNQLAAMDESDFMDGGASVWGLGADQDEEADRLLLEKVNQDLEDVSLDITKTAAKRRKNLPIAEKLKILQTESPELLELIDEFTDKSQMADTMQHVVLKIKSRGMEDGDEAKFILLKYQLLLHYMTNVSFYFALKASGATDIQNHPVIETLVELRTTIEKMEKSETKLQSRLERFVRHIDQDDAEDADDSNTLGVEDANDSDKEEEEEEEEEEEHESPAAKTVKPKKTPAVDTSEDEFEAESGDDGPVQFQDIEEEFRSMKKSAKKRRRAAMDDFGEMDVLDEIDYEDKAAKKRSLRDYVAKIDAKQSKLQSKYHGDSDLPYRDRTPREKKGVPQPADNSAELDNEDWDEADVEAAKDVREERGDDVEYYEQTASSKKARKAAKKELYESERAPNVDIDVNVDEGQKRLASYKILKNKGLTPHRKKENRNSRVKNRNKYASKLKKLSSSKRVVKPLSGNYGGETTGIKGNVVRSVRF